MAREQWQQVFLGTSVPRLWCPPITHYAARGLVDRRRMEAHWRQMVPYLGGFLVPGSTGDGWEMDAGEVDALIVLALELARRLGTRILIGALRPTADATVAAISRVVAMLKAETGTEDAIQALRAGRVAGFTVCPPTGARLTQARISSALEQVLALGLPTALYQLPQVTGNEMTPALVADLAQQFPHLMMLKDTSGGDRIAVADAGESGLFLVRGAEGAYASWLHECGGPYDGLLLSTANCFARHLRHMINCLESGDLEVASGLSAQVTDTIEAAFGLVAPLPFGNQFSNANKAIDHWMAYGPDAMSEDLPLVHCGERLPAEMVQDVGELLREMDLLPTCGYLRK